MISDKMIKCILLLFIAAAILENSSCSRLNRHQKSKKVKGYTKPPVLYHDLESIISVLHEPKHYSVKAVQKLLKYYYKARNKRAKFEANGGKKKYPLIVVEGLSGTGKTTISLGLSRILNASHCHTPPRNLKKYRLKADLKKNRVIYNAYHQLCQYITGEEVYPLLQNSPVILDRYWHSAASFSIARSVYVDPEKMSMPPKGDKAYNWPDDLLKPDVVLFLAVDEETRYQRISGRGKSKGRLGGNEKLLHESPEYRNNVISAYKNMQNPGITEIDDSPPVAEVLKETLEKLQPLFKNDTSFNIDNAILTAMPDRKTDSKESSSEGSQENSNEGSEERSNDRSQESLKESSKE